MDTLSNSDISGAIWRRVARDHELKFTMKDGHIFKFDGFKEKVCLLSVFFLILLIKSFIMKFITIPMFVILIFLCR